MWVELLLLAGVVGQVVALRLLAIQLARTPDDPRLVRKQPVGYVLQERRRRRHRRIVRVAVAGFSVATLVTLTGLVALVLRVS